MASPGSPLPTERLNQLYQSIPASSTPFQHSSSFQVSSNLSAIVSLPTLVVKSQNLQGFRATPQHRSIWFSGLKRRVMSHDTALVLLQETHVSSGLEAEQLQRQWCAAMGVPFNEEAPISFWSVGASRSAGVAVLVNPFILRSFTPTNQARWSDNFISIQSDEVQVLCVYAPTNRKARKRLFEQLADITLSRLPTILGGDFNCVLDSLQDRYSTSSTQRAIVESPELNLLLSGWGLVDSVHQRRQLGDTVEDRRLFRLEHHTHHSRTGSARLDRVYLSPDLAGWVSSVRTTAPQNTSDHQEVAVVLRPPDCAQAGPKTKCSYRPASRRHARFLERLQPRLARIAGIAERLPHADFDFDVFVKKAHLAITKTKVELSELRRRRLHAARRRARGEAPQGSRSDVITSNVRANKTRRANQAGEATARGVTSTAAQFQRVSAREWDQSITTLHSEVGNFQATDSIADRFRKAWAPLFGHQPTDAAAFPYTVPSGRQVAPEASRGLIAAITLSEVHTVLRQLRKNKRAGPDGLPNEFYQDSADLLAPVLLRVCQVALKTGKCPDSFAHALIFPIRKNGDSVDPMQYRPISLLNSSYKILAKILANRVVKILDQLIGQQQNGYVPSRRMEDSVNIMLAALHLSDVEVNTAPADSPVVVLLDFTKAYDSLDRTYLFNVLRRFGFPPTFVKLVEGMHHGTTAQFLANGLRSNTFAIDRGIRQGCPLAPYLFILAMDPLATMFHARSHEWGLRFGEGDSSAYHVFSGFVDDSALFLRRASIIPQALQLLDGFAHASGLRVNPTKSHAIFLQPRNCLSSGAYERIPVLPTGETTRYLGVQIGVADLVAANWATRLAKFANRLAIIARRRHAFVDRASLASSILSPAVRFTAQFFWPTVEVLQQLDAMVYHFLWHGLYTQEKATRWPISADILRLPRALGGIQAPSFLRDITIQAGKKVLRWALLRPSIERIVGALLLRPRDSCRTSSYSLELRRSVFIPILQHRRLHHWPKASEATVWSIGEGELAIASGLPALAPSELLPLRTSWWHRLRSLACVRSLTIVDNRVSASFMVPIWLSRAWEEFTVASRKVIPQQIASFWTQLNIVGNPWFRTRDGDIVRSGHYGLHGDFSITDLAAISQVDNHFRCIFTAAGSNIILQRDTANGRTKLIHQWLLLFLLNCPHGLGPSPMTLRPAIPPFTEWTLTLPASADSRVLELSSETDSWTIELPRIGEPLPRPHQHPLTQRQARWLQVARCVPVFLNPHPELHRTVLLAPSGTTASSHHSYERRLAQIIRTRFHQRGLSTLEQRLAAWRKRDSELSQLLEEQSWSSLWSARVHFTAEDRVFRYKFRIGALNTRRSTMTEHPHCPLHHCHQHSPDTLLHVFWDCSVAQTLWTRVLSQWSQRHEPSLSPRSVQLSILTEVNPYVPAWLWSHSTYHPRNEATLRSMTRFLWAVLIRSFMRTIWRVRNEEVYHGIIRTADTVFHTGVHEFLHRTDALIAAFAQMGDIAKITIVRIIRQPWLTLDTVWPTSAPVLPNVLPMDLLFFDGGSRGNPGPGAGGAVHVAYRTGTWEITWFGIQVCSAEDTTNNVAEYAGLLVGLRYLHQHSITSFRLIGDSRLILRQLQGRARVRSPTLLPLFLEAMKFLDHGDAVTFHHHRRENNTMADLLSNIGMDTSASTASFSPHRTDRSTALLLQARLANDLSPLHPQSPTNSRPSSPDPAPTLPQITSAHTRITPPA